MIDDARHMQTTSTSNLDPLYQNYERQKCFIGYCPESPRGQDLVETCKEILDEFSMDPWYESEHFDPTQSLREKVVEMIANTRCGIYDISQWRKDNKDEWHLPSNVFLELGIAIALNRPLLILRHTDNVVAELPLPTILGNTSLVEFKSFTELEPLLRERLTQWQKADPQRDWWNRYCTFGNRFCGYRETHPHLRQWGQEKLQCHISDGPDTDRDDFRGVIEDVLGNFDNVAFRYLDWLPMPEGYNFQLCGLCQTIRSSPFAIYRISEQTPAETYMAIGMSLALESQFEQKIPKIMRTGSEDIPMLLDGYDVVTAQDRTTWRRKLRVFTPQVIRQVRKSTWKARPLPFIAVKPGADEQLTSSVSLDEKGSNDYLAVIGKYGVIKEIERNEMAVTYLVRDTENEQFYAMKRLHSNLASDSWSVTRFHREADILCKLTHPHILHGIEKGEDSTVPYVVIEYVEGQILRELMQATGPMEVLCAMKYARQIAEGLGAAYALGIAHNELGRENILVDNQDQIKVTGFGIEHEQEVDERERTQTKPNFVRPYSTAPEVIQRASAADIRSDLYALAVVFFNMLSGSPPFGTGGDVDVMQMHLSAPVPSLCRQRAELSGVFDLFMQKAMAKSPTDRYQTPAEFLSALDHLQQAAALTPANNRTHVPVPSNAKDIPPLVGTTLGQYRIFDVLNDNIFKAFDTSQDRIVTVTVFPDLLEFLKEETALRSITSDLEEVEHPILDESILRELRPLTSLSHPNLVPLYDFGLYDNRVFSVEEYVAVVTLKEKLATGIEFQQAIAYVLQVAEGLTYLYAHDLAYPSVQSENIAVHSDDHVLLPHWELLNVFKTVIVTLSPSEEAKLEELLQKEGNGIDLLSIIYALGLILVECLTSGKTAPIPSWTVTPEEAGSYWADDADFKRAVNIRNSAKHATPPLPGLPQTPQEAPSDEPQQIGSALPGNIYKTTPLPQAPAEEEETGNVFYPLMDDAVPASPLHEQHGSAIVNGFDTQEHALPSDSFQEPVDEIDSGIQVEDLSEDPGTQELNRALRIWDLRAAHVPIELQRVAVKMMREEPSERYQSMEEVIDALRNALVSVEQVAQEEHTAEKDMVGMERCAFCDAATKPEDEHCDNCGNRLLPKLEVWRQPTWEQPIWGQQNGWSQQAASWSAPTWGQPANPWGTQQQAAPSWWQPASSSGYNPRATIKLNLCWICGEDWQRGTTVCPNCGKMRDVCPYCSAECRPEDNFCLNCGTRLTSDSLSSTPPGSPTSDDRTQPLRRLQVSRPLLAPGSPTSDDRTQLRPFFPFVRYCPACGTATSDPNFCEHCGRIWPKVIACTSCHAIIQPGAVYCMGCGIQVAPTQSLSSQGWGAPTSTFQSSSDPWAAQPPPDSWTTRAPSLSDPYSGYQSSNAWAAQPSASFDAWSGQLKSPVPPPIDISELPTVMVEDVHEKDEDKQDLQPDFTDHFDTAWTPGATRSTFSLDDLNNIGKTFGDYRILREIGQGGLGRVYLALHTTSYQSAAVKLFYSHLSAKQHQQLFFLASQVLEHLHHAYILPIIKVNLHEEPRYLISTYAPRGSLHERLQTGQPLSLESTLTILMQIGEALAHIHQHNIVHRDLKPGNILFNDANEALLSDFDIAVVLDTGESKKVDKWGSPPYMAPEQFKGEVSRKSDQYALGCIAYKLVTGRRPFDDSRFVALQFKHSTQSPIPPRRLNPTLPLPIEQAILRTMAKNPADRFPDIPAFLDAIKLEGVLDVGSAEARKWDQTAPTTPLSLTNRERQRQGIPVVQAALAAGAGNSTQLERVLVEIDGQVVKEQILNKDEMTVGRASECDIVVPVESVSRLHASIVNLGNGNYAVKDEGSANGTRVNGQPIPKYQFYPLQYGDYILLAPKAVLTFRGSKL